MTYPKTMVTKACPYIRLFSTQNATKLQCLFTCILIRLISLVGITNPVKMLCTTCLLASSM